MATQSVVTLLQHPSQLEEFKSDLSLAKDVTNECLRYNTASALNSRRAAKEDLVVGGKVIVFSPHPDSSTCVLIFRDLQHIKKGEGVICLVQSGDRDESYFENADRFDIHRNQDPRDSLGFGYGSHRCIAEGLSRMELGIALSEFPFLR